MKNKPKKNLLKKLRMKNNIKLKRLKVKMDKN